jgi:YggT family protein
MFILSNLLLALAQLLNLLLTVFYWLILIRALISWVNPDPYNAIVQFLHKVTEPVLVPIRRILPFSLKMTIDISPFIAFLIIFFLRMFLVKSLMDLAVRIS